MMASNVVCPVIQEFCGEERGGLGKFSIVILTAYALETSPMKTPYRMEGVNAE
jgi:hypothetical protein